MQLRKAEHTGNHARKPDEWRYYPEVSARRAADIWCRNHFMRIDSTWLRRRPHMPPTSIKRVFEPISEKIGDVTRPSGHPGEFCSAHLDTHRSSPLVVGCSLMDHGAIRHPDQGKLHIGERAYIAVCILEFCVKRCMDAVSVRLRSPSQQGEAIPKAGRAFSLGLPGDIRL